MAEACSVEIQFAGIVEVDESYFGPKRGKGKAGRGAGRKTPAFGIFKHHGNVYIEIGRDCSKAVFAAAIRCRVFLDSIICSEDWRG